MEGFEVLTGRDNVDLRLLMSADPSLARVMGHLNLCTCFAGLQDGENVAACLLDEKGGDVCDIVNFSVAETAPDSVQNALLLHIMEYARGKNFRYLDVGAGNARLDTHRDLQKMGFRVIGVIPDYYQADGKSLAVENSIVNRDMIRYRVDFQDGWTTWTEEVK